MTREQELIATIKEAGLNNVERLIAGAAGQSIWVNSNYYHPY
ncbi:hypothetical protein SAMN05518672_103551 [Chitinophaga sp. CF118]|nr:hypothetical protein SAMN05518672_103551 [Chitinophaga sp. CF118]